MKEQNSFWKGMLCGLCAAFVIVCAAYGLPILLDAELPFPAKEETKAEEEEQRLSLSSREVQEKLEKMEHLINTYYLNDIDEEQVLDLMYTGIMYGLGDKYASYYGKEEYTSMRDATSGSYCGIGAQFSQNYATGIIEATKVYEGSPAMEGGLLPGDRLYAIDGELVEGEDLTVLVTKIKGEENTQVTLSVLRSGEADPVELTLTRGIVEIPTVAYEMLEDQIGYIQIQEFDSVTGQQFQDALDALTQAGMRAMIVDVRNNPGGVVDAVAEVLDQLLPEGIIVYMEDKDGNRQEERYSDAEHYFDKPMAVLVNENSASASEIFASAIKDYEMGTLVGTTTYGKGIAQSVFNLGDDTGIRLTYAKYYTKSGVSVHETGVDPDIQIDLDEEIKKKAVIPKEEDTQLQKAIELFK